MGRIINMKYLNKPVIDSEVIEQSSSDGSGDDWCIIDGCLCKSGFSWDSIFSQETKID